MPLEAPRYDAGEPETGPLKRLPFRFGWNPDAFVPARIRLRKFVSLLGLVNVSANADLCLPEGEVFVGVSARDSLLDGRISIDAASRTVSYCKDVAIPNGLTLAVDAGLQYVGARPLPPPPARGRRRAASPHDISRSPPGGYPSGRAAEGGGYPSGRAAEGGGYPSGRAAEGGGYPSGRAAEGGGYPSGRAAAGATHPAAARFARYSPPPYGAADEAAPASELLSRYASAAAHEIRRRVRPFVGFQVWAGGQGAPGGGAPRGGGFERTALAPDGSLVFCRAVTLPPRLIGFSYPRVSADAAVSVAFPAYSLGGAAGGPGGGLFVGTPGGTGIGFGGGPRRGAGGAGGWRLGGGRGGLGGGWRFGGRSREEEEQVAATLRAAEAPNRDLVSIRVEAYDIVFDF